MFACLCPCLSEVCVQKQAVCMWVRLHVCVCVYVCEVCTITTVKPCLCHYVFICHVCMYTCIGTGVCTYSHAAFLHRMLLYGSDHPLLTCLNSVHSS